MAETLDKIINAYDTLMVDLKQEKEVDPPKFSIEAVMQEATKDLVKNGVGGGSPLVYLEKSHELNDKLHKLRAIVDSEFIN